nr:2-oxo acid dehydrogenase subunit E2 [Synergistales bacterium]
MQGGTFTITNLGMFGMHDFTPIINPPEACILAVNSITEKPVVVGGEITIRPISMLGLTADHRILDGADAARFLSRIKEIIENPYLLIL